MTEATTTTLPPYIAYRTLEGFLLGLKQGIPPCIDRSLMTSYSGSVTSQLLHALRYLGLIDQDGVVTERLKALVGAIEDEQEYARELQQALEVSYPFLFSLGAGNFDLAESTSGQLRKMFEATRATGETIVKCQSFFLAAAKAAKIDLSPHITKHTRQPRQRGSKSKRVRKPKPTVVSAKGENAEEQAPPQWQAMLLAKFPDFDPEWPDDLKRQWFKDFDRFLGATDEEEQGGREGGDSD